MIKVSVIITTFGSPVLLEKAIDSVVNQTLSDLELIVVDDNDPGSDARFQTEKIIGRIDNPTIIYLKHDRNRNGAAARNTGLRVAKGKYIAFLDNDDQYNINRLQKCFSKMELCSDTIAGVYTGCEFRRNGKKYDVFKEAVPGNFLVQTLACTFMLSTGSNLFIRKKVIKELNGFDETFLRHQDYEFMVRLFMKYNIEAIPDVLVIKNNENVNLPSVENMIKIKEKYLSKFREIIMRQDKLDQNYIYHSANLAIAEHALRTNRLSIANEYYEKANAFGSLTLRNRLRKIYFTIFNLAQ